MSNGAHEADGEHNANDCVSARRASTEERDVPRIVSPAPWDSGGGSDSGSYPGSNVYVISNLGAFGPNVVKIGMTRRLEPMDRVHELGDASVPFPFDVHALYFSDDAVTLETELHHAFAANRLNHVNARREFFFATPTEVRTVLAEKVGNLLEFTEDPEATQYNQSRKYWPPTLTSND